MFFPQVLVHLAVLIAGCCSVECCLESNISTMNEIFFGFYYILKLISAIRYNIRYPLKIKYINFSQIICSICFIHMYTEMYTNNQIVREFIPTSVRNLCRADIIWIHKIVFEWSRWWLRCWWRWMELAWCGGSVLCRRRWSWLSEVWGYKK